MELDKGSTARRWKPFAVLVLLLALHAGTGHGQSVVFTTCDFVEERGFTVSAAPAGNPAVESFCSVDARAQVEQATSVEDTTVQTEAFATASAVGAARPDLPDFSTFLPSPDDDVGSGDVAISTSSAGGVPFTVPGGRQRTDVSDSFAQITTLINLRRPPGPWYTIVAVDVTEDPAAIFSAIRELQNYLSIAFKGLAQEVGSIGEERVAITLPSGERAVVELEDLNEARRFHTHYFTELSPGIFPGFDFVGVRLYVQVSRVFGGGAEARSTIEVGWGPPSDRPLTGSNLVIGIRLLDALLLEIQENLESRFGQTCEFGLNIRTIEGDCNNLGNPPQGSAGNPLRRLGGSDPAYPGGDVSVTEMPGDISPREISNNLFAMSPGMSILEAQVQELSSRCASTTDFRGDVWEVCPFKQATRRGLYPLVVPFLRVEFDDCEDLSFVFQSSSCRIEIRLKCSGETRLELADNPCGAETNRLFDPVGCVIAPAEDGVLENTAGLTDLFFTFAQFIDHDYGLSPTSQINREQPGFSRLSRPAIVDELPIEVPEGDFHFPDRGEFDFERARFSDEDPLSQVNLHSSYLDGSQIYGVDFARARLLRSFVGGRLDLSAGDLPPFNGVGGPGSLGAVVDNGPNTESRFFVVGDARGNEQVMLLAMHILFLREHNLVADEVAAAFPDFDDERIYQTARAIVIAEYQCIVYEEWLPLLLGDTSPRATDFSYDPGLDATVSAIFTTSPFRFGHTLVGTNILQMGPGSPSSAQMILTPIRDVFFSPEMVSNAGIDPFIRGGAWHLCKELDHKIVDELRNFLVIDFDVGVTDPPLFDLMALNLQRGRDMGIPRFNAMRALFNLPEYTSFSEFIADPNLADLASETYNGDVDLVDSFFGGLVETATIPNSQLRESFNVVVADQFRRSRDGDRFFYTGLQFDPALVAAIPRLTDIINNEVTLRDIILRTTGITNGELGTRPSVFQV